MERADNKPLDAIGKWTIFDDANQRNIAFCLGTTMAMLGLEYSWQRILELLERWHARPKPKQKP
jgi:hypothetical protein